MLENRDFNCQGAGLDVRRLESLWQIASTRNVPGEKLIAAMLEHAAEELRPGPPLFGLLGRIEGAEVVALAVTGDQAGPARGEPLRAGTRVPLALVQAFGRWAAIAKRFTAGSATYVLTFASTRRAEHPFGPRDHAYVEILSELFALRLDQQRPAR